jgi:hypothetical protein
VVYQAAAAIFPTSSGRSAFNIFRAIPAKGGKGVGVRLRQEKVICK